MQKMFPSYSGPYQKWYIVFTTAIVIGIYLAWWIIIIADSFDVTLGIDVLSFIFSILVSIILFLINMIIKYFDEQKANTIIILNLQKILNYSNKIQDMEKTPQNFKLSKGPFGLPVSIADYILFISNDIENTLHFTNLFATNGNINLIQDIFEILPELKKILKSMKYANPTSLEQNFDQKWSLFHSKITKFENFTVKEYFNNVNNSEKYTSKFIKYDLDLDST